MQVTVPSAFSSWLTLWAAPLVTLTSPDALTLRRISPSYRWTRIVRSDVLSA